MKNLNILGVHWEIRFLGGGGVVHKKNNIEEGIAKKGELGHFADLRDDGLVRKGGIFEGG